MPPPPNQITNNKKAQRPSTSRFTLGYWHFQDEPKPEAAITWQPDEGVDEQPGCEGSVSMPVAGVVGQDGPGPDTEGGAAQVGPAWGCSWQV